MQMKKMEKKRILPIVISIMALCVVALLITPMLKSAPHDIPVAVLNVDEGPGGAQAITMLERIEPVEISKFTSQTEFDKAVNDNKFYAWVIIPSGYSASQITENPAKLQLTINQGKNPTVASAVQTMFMQITIVSEMKITFETNYVNAIPADMGVGTIATIIGMFIFLPSWITAMFIAINLRSKSNIKKERFESLSIQLAYCAGLALLIGLGATLLITAISGASLPFFNVMMFVAIASFAFQLIVLAAVNWFGYAGLIIPVTLLILGMSALSLPYEFLPQFWQNCIYPWIPQRFMAEGAREILFMDKSFFNFSTLCLSIIAFIGFTGLFATLLKPWPKLRKSKEVLTD